MTLLNLYFANMATEVNTGFNTAKHKARVKETYFF